MSTEHYDHGVQTAPCPKCGQGIIAAGSDSWCIRCRRGQYGHGGHGVVKLFEPAPATLRGQLGLERHDG